jgi:MtN3 and saliva related transmembrane protein
MDIIFIIGMLAAALTTIAFLPQVIKAHQSKHTKDLSLEMFIVFSTGLILWIVYGVILQSLPIILANSITLLLCIYLIALKIKYG